MNQFDGMWVLLSRESKCDEIGSTEYERVKREWIEWGRADALREFITRRANVGPDDEKLK